MTPVPYYDIYGERDLAVFQALARLVVQERVTGMKPTIEQIRDCGQLEHPYPSNVVLSIVMTLASGPEGGAFKIERIGTVGELRDRGEF